jgi:hypothetical protein
MQGTKKLTDLKIKNTERKIDRLEERLWTGKFEFQEEEGGFYGNLYTF